MHVSLAITRVKYALALASRCGEQVCALLFTAGNSFLRRRTEFIDGSNQFGGYRDRKWHPLHIGTLPNF
jgi:hypothetical protein